MRLLKKVKTNAEWARDHALIAEQLERVGFDATGVVVLDELEALQLRQALGIAANAREGLLPPLSEAEVRHQEARAILLRGHEERSRKEWDKGPTDWRAR